MNITKKIKKIKKILSRREFLKKKDVDVLERLLRKLQKQKKDELTFIKYYFGGTDKIERFLKRKKYENKKH